MSGADAARGENIGEFGAQRVQCGDDFILKIADDPYFAQVDADSGEIIRDEADVLVLGPAGQDFVADNQQPRSDDLHHLSLIHI